MSRNNLKFKTMKNQAITLGQVGILLPIAAIFLFWIPLIGQLIALAPLVLLLISHHKFSNVYDRPEIFKTFLLGVIIPFAGALLGVIILLFAMGAAFSTMYNPDQLIENILAMGVGLIILAIIGYLLIFACAIIGVFLIFKSLKALAEACGVDLFRLAGLIYLVTYVGGIGLLILLGIIAFAADAPGLLFVPIILMPLAFLAGWITHIIAYFKLKPDPKTT